MTKPQIMRRLINSSGCVTQKEFAHKHGTQPERISEWVTGSVEVSNKTLTEIAKTEGFKLTIELKLEKL